MTPGSQFLKNNAFLVAAASLPVLVVVFFVLASVIPRWLVPPPAYDLLLSVGTGYDQTRARIAVDYKVSDGRVEANVRAVPATVYPQQPALFLFDHQTMSVREIPVNLPTDLKENDPPRVVAVDALAGKRIVAEPRAPDGYMFEGRPSRGPGIIGELFGMSRYDRKASLTNGGRVVPLTLPSQYLYQPVTAVGWVVDATQR
jgi:hypothetical protein